MDTEQIPIRSVKQMNDVNCSGDKVSVIFSPIVPNRFQSISHLGLLGSVDIQNIYKPKSVKTHLLIGIRFHGLPDDLYSIWIHHENLDIYDCLVHGFKSKKCKVDEKFVINLDGIEIKDLIGLYIGIYPEIDRSVDQIIDNKFYQGDICAPAISTKTIALGKIIHYY